MVSRANFFGNIKSAYSDELGHPFPRISVPLQSEYLSCQISGLNEYKRPILPEFRVGRMKFDDFM